MTESNFVQHFDRMHQRLIALRQSANATAWQQPELLTTVFAEMGVVLEELRLAEEELYQQNEDLIATRQSVELEREWYQELFEFAPDGYLVTSQTGMIQAANSTAADLLKVPRRFLVGKTLSNFVVESERLTFQNKLNQLTQTNQLQEWTVKLRPRKGATFTASLSVVVRRQSNKSTTLHWLLRNTTERKQIEAELQKTNDELEARVEQRTAQLNHINEQLHKEIVERQKVERSLRASEERFRNLIQDLHVGVLVHGANAQVLMSNRAAQNLLGLTEAELLSKPSFEDWHIIYENGAPFNQKEHPVLQAIATHKPLHGIVISVYRPTQNDRIWLLINVDPQMKPDGSIHQVICSFSEITAQKQTEAALRQSEERYRQMFERNQAIKLLVDSQSGAIVDVNLAAATFYGYSLTDLKRMKINDINVPLTVEQASEEMAQAAAEGRSSFWFRHRLITGEIRDVEVHSGPIDIGEQKLLYVIVQDITERKRTEAALRESEERFRSLVSNIPGVIYRCTFDSERIIEYISDAIATISGYPAADFVHSKVRTFSSLYHPEDATKVKQAVMESLHTKQPFVMEHRLIRADGGIRWVHEKGQAVFDQDGTVLWLDGAIFDITERKQAEEETQKALEREKELSELKSRFVSMTSHEFRTPLSTIMLSAGLLEKYSQGWDEERKNKHLHRIQASVKHMTELLEGVLILGKAEADKLEFQPVPLNVEKLCHDLLEEIQLNASPHHAIVFSNQYQHTQINSDERLLRQILTNLLSNAIKYSPQGGTVRLELAWQSENIVFRIQDEGIGIPVEDQKRLFESFHRASNVGQISGTGLGLAIAKRCVNLHGGQITVQSELGVGTTFTVTLPLNNQVQVDEKNSGH